MSVQAKRYDTLVIENATSKTIPQEAAGGRVVSWSAGHALAESSAYENFISVLLNEEFSTIEEAQDAAHRAQELAELQRRTGYV